MFNSSGNQDSQSKFLAQKKRTTIALIIWILSIVVFLSHINEEGIGVGFLGITVFLISIYAFINVIEYRQASKRLK